MPDIAKNDCACDKCISACKRKPGWFHPDQIKPLAKALKITITQLFERHLSVDWWAGDDMTGGKDVFVLSPRLDGQTGGALFPGDPHGTCHWFQGGKCQIHHLGKPDECAFAHHDVSDGDYFRNHLKIVTAWIPHQARIARLLGKSPIAAAYDGEA